MAIDKKKHTVLSLSKAAKINGERLAAVTAYSCPMARFAESAGIDLLLVGDSVGMVEHGHSTTLPVTMDEMIVASKAVRRGAPNTFIVGDMPFMSYQASNEDAIRNAGRFIAEGGCDAVKVEYCGVAVERIAAIVSAGILVMGHVGFTPQRVSQLGGYRVQGRGDAAQEVLLQAHAVQRAGAFCVLLEMVPPETSKLVTEKLDVFTIGVGAGPAPRMQMVVLNDLLGMFEDFTPRYVRKYADLRTVITDALKKYAEDVKSSEYPGPEHCYPEE